MNDAILLTSAIAVVLVTAIAVLLFRRRRMSAEGARTLALAVAEGQATPPSLHPVIDATLCIGSFSCMKACPEGDIIGVVDGVATLVEAAHCIGHARCAVECPVGAIKLVFGTAEKGVDLPETDESFESSRPGVYVIGELGGMGLIKNALRQGIDVGRSLKKKLKQSEAQGAALVDVAIVGGGPAGIACAASCKEQGLVARVFEQESLGGCIAHYPRGKVVMSEAVLVPGYGKFGRALLSKEELLGELRAVLEKNALTIDEGHKVEKIDGEAGMFTVKTSRGLSVHARAVVLATGLRGTPRKLNVPGEDSAKVTYRLIDPEQFHGRRVLVVGGGDSAVEAAVQLAEESTAKVSISYRQPNFSRCKPRNLDNISRLIAEGRVRALFNTEVDRIEGAQVILKTPDGDGKLKNDHVIVSAGGELPAKFLESVNVSIRKYKGEERGAAVSKDGGPARALTKAEVETRTRRRLALFLFALGSAIITGLFLVGRDYYTTPIDMRGGVANADFLKPAGLWGHGVGVGATAFMIFNFAYALRKRWTALKGTASIRTWLTFHMFVGIMSPLVIAFHAAFMLNNLLAVWTWIALSIVVGTGIVGRFLFGFVPAQAGKVLALSEVRSQLEDIRKQIEPRLAEATNAETVRKLFESANAAPESRSFFRTVVDDPGRRRRLVKAIDAARPYFHEDRHFTAFRDGLLLIARGRVQVAFYAGLKRLFRGWLVIHIVLAIFMVVLIGAHVGVSLYLGFKWILP